MMHLNLKTIALVVGFSLARIVAGCPSAWAMQEDHNKMECVVPLIAAKPPSKGIPKVRPERRRDRDLETSKQIQPFRQMCPDGQVPIPVFPDHRAFPKGNPMFVHEGKYDTAQTTSANSQTIKRILPFDQVYRKKRTHSKRYQSKPFKDLASPACQWDPKYGVCYYYATAGNDDTADGGGMTFQIVQPDVDPLAGSGDHSIGQIAVSGPRSGNGGLNDVEMGFSVAPGQWGDTKPHLFVFYWHEGTESCYNTCDWNQVSTTYYPRMDLTPLIGYGVYMGWVHYNNAWWAWFNDEWLGYYKDSEWTESFPKERSLQWYGEVSSSKTGAPQWEMGNGQFPANPGAAFMNTLCSVDGEKWLCVYGDTQSIDYETPQFYQMKNHTTFGGVRYGGPGH